MSLGLHSKYENADVTAVNSTSHPPRVTGIQDFKIWAVIRLHPYTLAFPFNMEGKVDRK